eukprot:c21757_g1_i2 orf=324-2216(+)
MKFKLLHVRPHVWFFKQNESIAKATSDDNSTEGPFVYKRSTSLKLVKSDPSVGAPNGRGDPLDLKPSSTHTGLSGITLQNQGKDVRVCTVVDAGCTCRATVTSQHKQKKAVGAHQNVRDVSNIHDMCRPRRTQVLESRGDVGSEHDTCLPRRMHLDAKRMSNASSSLGTSSGVMSRLVCKSSHDVVKHSELNVEKSDVVCKSSQDEDKQFDAGMTNNKACLDAHQLECRLRNAGLEERRRSTKKNKYYEEGSLTSSGISSSSISTNANTDTVITGTTSEMQNMLLNANPAYDTDAACMGESMISLEDLRASIAQRKLANHSLQGSPRASLQMSPCMKDAGLMDGMSENVAFTGSPCALSSPCVQNNRGQLYKEKLQVSVKHVDVGVNNRVYLSECEDQANEGLVKQGHKAGYDTPSKIKDVGEDEKALLRRAARRIHLSRRKGADVSYELEKSIANRMNVGLAQGEVHDLNHEAELDVVALGRIRDSVCNDIGQEKQVVSSSSCEIQVLSDYNYSDDNHTHPIMRCATSSSLPSYAGATMHMQGTPPHALEATPLGHELMRTQSAVAMVKSSYDPKRDFKESMLEMVVAKRLCAPRQLQQLLQCYLSLNPSHYHPTIIKVFHELCSELFN